jgi:hypothetical protein
MNHLLETLTRPLPRWPTRLFALLAVATVFLQLTWVSLDGTQARDDDAHLYADSLCYEQLARTSLTRARDCVTPYPPLVPAVAAVHYRIFGRRDLTLAVQSLWPFYLLLMVSLYAGVRREAGETAGLAAAMLGPVVANSLYLRGTFYTEVPLLALSVASIAALVASEGFTRRGPCVALGMCLGAGLLTKWSFAFFLGPPMVIAVMAALWRVGTRWWVGAVPAALAGVASLALVAAAAGRFPPGAWIAASSVGAAAAWLGVIGRHRPAHPAPVLGAPPAADTGAPPAADAGPMLAADAGSRLVGLILVTSLVAALALPWYLWNLSSIRRFLDSNLSFTFDADRMVLAESWPYYPAVVLTRALGTPLVLLLLTGCARWLLPGRSRLAGWSMLAFLSGLGILASLPYRAGRYIAAGLGLLVPTMVRAIDRPGWLSRSILLAVLAGSLFYQVSWMPMAAGGRGMPLPRLLISMPRRDLFGNLRSSMPVARHDLVHPRWYLNAVAPPPVRQAPPTGRIVAGLAARSGKGVPFYAVLIDPSGLANADVLRVEALARGLPAGLRVVPGGPVLETEALFQALSGMGARIDQVPANFFLVVVSDLGAPEQAAEARRRTAFLRAQGFQVVLRDGLPFPKDAVVQVWQRATPAPPRLMWGG